MGNINNILELAVTALQERYGEDFQLENGDEFVFSLHNGAFILSLEDGNFQIKVLGNEMIPLDAEFEGIFADE